MALIWADFPSGQKGLYGLDAFRMTDGIWSGFDDFMRTNVFPSVSTAQTNVVADPDPTVSGYVLHPYSGTIQEAGPRLALPGGATSTVGLGCRMWLEDLPTGDWGNHGGPLLTFRTAGNVTIASVTVLANGRIAAATTRSGTTLLGTSLAPVIQAGAWNHVEVKMLRHASAGTLEVRVNGVAVSGLVLTGLALGASDIGIVAFGSNYAVAPSGTLVYYKDIIIWDGTGSEVNDFQGNVSVTDLNPDTDVSLGGWLPNVGSTGFPLVRDTLPQNTLTSIGAVAAAETVRINSTYYAWTAGSVDAGTPAGTLANPWLVALGGSAAASIENLYKAIGASGVAGTTYSTGLTAHTTVTPLGYTATQLTVVPTDGTTTSMTFAETGTNISWKSSSTLFYYPTDTSYVTADSTPPVEAEMTVTNLPAEVTSVRGVIAIARAFNSDGGDGKLQVSLSPNGVDYALGTDRPLTTAATYYWDVSEVSPDTSVAWLPSEVDTIRIRFDRTL